MKRKHVHDLAPLLRYFPIADKFLEKEHVHAVWRPGNEPGLNLAEVGFHQPDEVTDSRAWELAEANAPDRGKRYQRHHNRRRQRKQQDEL